MLVTDDFVCYTESYIHCDDIHERKRGSRMDNQNGYYTQAGGGMGTDPYESPPQGTYGGTAESAQGSSYGGIQQNPYGNPAGGAYVYGQGTGGYGTSPYGMGGMGYGNAPVPEDRFAAKLTCSILEMVSCNLISVIMGIIACVYTVKAHHSHKEGRWQDFKSEAKTSAVCLWVGLGFFVVGILGIAILWAIGDSVSGGLGSAYPYVYVDGTRMDIPSDYDTYEDLGYYLDRSDRFETLAPGEQGLYLMRNDYGDYVMWCWFENSGSYEAYVNECDIIGVDVDIYCDNYERYETSEGLGFFDSRQDYIDTYGRPDDTYMEEDGSELLCWYLGDGSDPVWRVMEVTFMDGRLYDIDVDYRR